MTKPTWVTPDPTTGTGNGQTSIAGAKHTGRVQRSGSISYEAEGATTIAQPVNQKPKAEFVTINNVSVSGTGGTVSITGKSNSTKLKFAAANGSTDLTLPTTYTAAGKTTDNDTAIASDPGAAAEYDFSIIVTVPENPTIAARTKAITVTTASDQTGTSTISQSAGAAKLSVSPASVTLEADGTPVTVTITSNTKWTVK